MTRSALFLLPSLLSLSCGGKEPDDTSVDTPDTGSETADDTGEDTGRETGGKDTGEADTGEPDTSSPDTGESDTGDTGTDCIPPTWDIELTKIKWDGGTYLGYYLADGLDLTGDGFSDIVVSESEGDFPSSHDGYNVMDITGLKASDNFDSYVVATFPNTLDVPYGAITAGGDLNGDGIGDLAGGPYFRYGPILEGEGEWDFRLAWAMDGQWWTYFVGDQNGDGREDVLLTPPDENAAYLVLGSVSSSLTLEEEASTRIERNERSSVGGGADLDGDGNDDLALTFTTEEGELNQGIFYGFIKGDLTVEDADVTLTDWMGGVGPLLEDWDGDGHGEIILFSREYAEVALLQGNASSGPARDEATVLLLGTESSTFDQAEDISGDGRVELLVGDPYACDEGRAYLVEFPGEGAFDIQDVASVVYGPKGENDSVRVGSKVVGSVDFDRDGQMDVIMSDDTSYGFDYSGTVYFIPGGGL